MIVCYRSDLRAPSGYGRASRAHARALLEAGVDVIGEVNLHDRTQMDMSNDPFWGDKVGGILRMDDFVDSPSSKRTPHVKIWQETPEFYEPNPLQYNIAYVVWETTRVIDWDMDGNPRMNWVRQINAMDEVWTASEFCAKVFRDCGVTVPINVFPHPIDLEFYKPGERHQFPVPGIEDQMVFLSVFQFTKRKNPHDMLLAWYAEFGQQDDVALMIKTYGSGFGDGDSKIREYLTSLRASTKIQDVRRNVHLLLDKVEEEDIPDLYRACDVFILPSYGEGFGMPYQEAMACGKPVIYTEATAMPEFCHGWSVACDPEPVSGLVHIPWYNAHQDWFKVRVNDLRRAMRDAYNAWKSGEIEACGAAARQKVESLHSHRIVGRAMSNRLAEIDRCVQAGDCRPELAAVWPAESADEAHRVLPDRLPGG